MVKRALASSLLVLTVTGGALATGTTAGSATPIAAAAWPAWLKHPQTPSCRPGETPLIPSSATTDAQGLAHVAYAAYPQLTTAVISPAARSALAKPSAALARDLVDSGLGVDSGSASTATSTAQALCVSASSSNPNWVPIAAPLARPTGNSQASPRVQRPPSPANGHYYTVNWAGYEVDGNFTGASGNWTVQQANPQSPSGSQDTTWVGVGGGNGSTVGSIIQTGTDMATGLGYRNWFEIFNDPRYYDAACNGSHAPSYGNCSGVSFTDPNLVRPGDAISAVAYWTSTTRACFTLIDHSRAAGGLSGCVSPVNVPYDASTIEWIDEAHTWYKDDNGNWYIYHFLMNFGQTNWTDADAYNPTTGQHKYFTDYGFRAAVMTSPNGGGTNPTGCVPNIMAVPQNASNGSSVTRWCAYD